MLIKNGKPVDLKENAEFQRFNKNIVPTLSDPVRFKHIRGDKINKGTGKLEPPIAFNIIFSVFTHGKEGVEEWAYAERTKMRKNTTNYLEPQKHTKIIYGNTFNVEKSNVEYLFFLMKKNTQFGGTFVLDDKIMDANDRVAKKEKGAELTAAIYTKGSPLADEGLLRDVAAAWGISQSYEKAPSLLKEQLEQAVLRGEHNKLVDKTAWGINELLEKINSTSEMRRRAIAQKALDKKIVEYDPISFYYKIKETGDKLLLVPTGELNNRDTYFVNKTTKDVDGIWKIIKKAIITSDMIEEWFKNKEYQWLADEEGLEKTMKVAEKKAKLMEIYS